MTNNAHTHTHTRTPPRPKTKTFMISGITTQSIIIWCLCFFKFILIFYQIANMHSFTKTLDFDLLLDC
jgi:hypothetical protein